MNDTREIDLLDLFHWLKKRFRLLLAACVISALTGALFTLLFVDVEYKASTRIYVLNRSSDAIIMASDYSVANYLVSDYTVLITGENVTNEVIEQLGLKMSASQLAKQISVSAIDSTRILQIEVVDTDPKRAADIANCTREISSRQIKEIMDVDAVNLVYEASVPQERSGPNLGKNTVLATFVGFVLTLGVMLIFYAVDDSLRTEEDVERFLGLRVLGVIPESSAMGRWFDEGDSAASAQ